MSFAYSQVPTAGNPESSLSVRQPLSEIATAFNQHWQNSPSGSYQHHDTGLLSDLIDEASIAGPSNAAGSSINQRLTGAYLALSTIIGAVAGTNLQTKFPNIPATLFSLNQSIAGAVSTGASGKLAKFDASGGMTFTGPVTATGFTGDVAGNATGVKGVATGALLIGAGTGAMTALAPGTSGQVLTSNGAGLAPSWQAASGGGSVSSANNLRPASSTTDATLQDIIRNYVSPNLPQALQVASGAANQLQFSAAFGELAVAYTPVSPANATPIWRANTAVTPVANSATSGTRAQFRVIADVSTGGTGQWTASLIAASASPGTNQFTLCFIDWDGTTWHFETADWSPVQQLVRTNWQPVEIFQPTFNDAAHPGNVTSASFAPVPVPSGQTITGPQSPLFSFELAQPMVMQVMYKATALQSGPPAAPVLSVAVLAGGSGYTNGAALTFSGGGGSGAAGTIVVTGGAITGVTITSVGSGYTSPPTVTAPTGTGAILLAVLGGAIVQLALFDTAVTPSAPLDYVEARNMLNGTWEEITGGGRFTLAAGLHTLQLQALTLQANGGMNLVNLAMWGLVYHP